MKNSMTKPIEVMAVIFLFLFLVLPSLATAQQTVKDYVNQGVIHLQAGQYDQAIAALSKAIELDPRYAHAYTFRGLAYIGKGQCDKAIADFTKAIELEPKSAQAYYFRGMIYSDASMGQYDHDQAIADFTRAIKLEPDDVDYYYRRGLAYSLKGQYDQAIADANKAIALDPKYAHAYYLKAIVCEEIKRNKEAIEAYRAFITHASPQDTRKIEQAKERIAELEKQQ